MSEYLESDFCSPEQGLDYVFGYMSAVYGASLNRHFEGSDLGFVRQVWGDVLGRYATYKPSLDFALKSMDNKFIPSALALKDLCQQGPRIPDKPHTMIEKQLTTEEKVAQAVAKVEAMKAIKQFTSGFGRMK
jgi:hypothetical protein